jgi:hypothetical protein
MVDSNSPGTLWDGDACQILEWKSGLCCEFFFPAVHNRFLDIDSDSIDGVPSNLNGQVQSASPYQGNNGACVLYQ